MDCWHCTSLIYFIRRTWTDLEDRGNGVYLYTWWHSWPVMCVSLLVLWSSFAVNNLIAITRVLLYSLPCLKYFPIMSYTGYHSNMSNTTLSSLFPPRSILSEDMSREQGKWPHLRLWHLDCKVNITCITCCCQKACVSVATSIRSILFP